MKTKMQRKITAIGHREKTGRINANVFREVEKLERRLMLSAVFPTVTQTQIASGTELAISVSGGRQITISQSATGVTITQAATTFLAGDLNQDQVVNFADLVIAVQGIPTAGLGPMVKVVQEMGWTDPQAPLTSILYPGTFSEIAVTCVHGDNTIKLDSTVTDPAVLQGGGGRDTLIAGAGDTVLYAGTGQDSLIAGSGTDTLVGLGTNPATLQGGTGVDSFWASSTDLVTNVSAAETALNAVHVVTAVPALASPAVGNGGGTYASFAADPLFEPGGPNILDIKQGSAGDCWFLSTLGAFAQTDAQQIRQDIVRLSDGTFLVRFLNGSVPVFEHIDATLPTDTGGGPINAKLGQDNSLWAPLLEKALAIFRKSGNTYSDLSSGWMNEAYADLGINGFDYSPNFWASPTDMLKQIQTQLSSHQAVTAGILTVPSGIPLIANHAYTVVAVTTDGSGNPIGLELRNPWGRVGISGYADNNGYITITPAQAFAAIAGTTVATV